MNAANDPAAWQNFYIMIGTANAALTGLLFIVRSLTNCWTLLTALEDEPAA